MEANKHTNTAQKFHQFAPKNGMYCIHSMYTKQRERELSFTQFCFHQSQNNHHKVIILKKKLKKKHNKKQHILLLCTIAFMPQIPILIK